MNKCLIGRIGEDMAARVLEAEGFFIVDRNYRCKLGEIDLILSKNGQMTFCEVKTRRSLTFGEPREAVDIKKKTRIINSANFFMLEHGNKVIDGIPIADMPMRFSVFEIFANNIEDAF